MNGNIENQQSTQPKHVTVRAMTLEDVPVVLDRVGRLLAELSGNPGAGTPVGADDVCRSFLDDDGMGAVFLAQVVPDLRVVGVITVSVQTAIRIGGPYALIQELWTDPECRSLAIGARLIQRVVEYCNEKQLSTIEVGLPGTRFPGLERTHAFYLRNGFVDLGVRMRKIVSR